MAPTEGASMIDLPIDYYQQSNNRSVSWLPPHTPHDGGDPPPKSVVLDTLVYVDGRTNASTAEGFTSNGHAIHVTFWPAHPPLLTYFTVHLPGLLRDGSATSRDLLPRLIRTDGGLALLRVIIGPSHSNPKHNNYIIYRAGANKLEVLPAHPTHLFSDSSVGLLSCPDGGRFFVANLGHDFSRGCGYYELDLFDSSSGAWSTRSMHAESPQYCYFANPTKVTTIGGSIVWVDIWNGILICDLLHGSDKDDDVLRFISLPHLVAPDKMISGPSLCDRDVAVTNDGCINYVEVWARPVPGSHCAGTYISQDWGVAIARWLEPEKKWRIHRTVNASEIIVHKKHSQLLPSHVKATRKSPTLSRLHAGSPALSLHEDDVVYIMTKVDHRNPESWMLAVDTGSKTLKGVADLSTRRSLSFNSIYFQSNISKHLTKSKEGEISKHLTKSKEGEISKHLTKSKYPCSTCPRIRRSSPSQFTSLASPGTSSALRTASPNTTTASSTVPASTSLRQKGKGKRNAAKTCNDWAEVPVKQGAMKTLANRPHVDADAMVAGCKHLVHGSKVKEQEHGVKILDFSKARISCS